MNLTRPSILLLALVLPACGKKDAAPAPAAGAPPATAPAAPAPPTGALADIDLAKAGPAWQGFHVKGVPGADVSDNGAGGVAINFTDNTMLQLAPAAPDDLKNFKQGLAANYKSVTYATDTATELVFTTVSDMGGNQIKGYGFSIVVTAGGKQVTCGSTYDDDATARRMRDVCKSLAK